MNRAQRITQQLGEFFADDEQPSTITPDDTVITTVTSKGWTCPTCGRSLNTGVMNPSFIMCPGCNHEVDTATGRVTYRTRTPNRTRGFYDEV